MTHAQRFGELRSLLHETPTPAAWDSLCALLDPWPLHELTQQALPYAIDHLKGWPDALRICPPQWVASLRDQRPHPALAIIRVLDDPRCFNATLAGLAQHPLPITSLRVRGQVDLQGARELAAWPSLSQLTSLDVASCRITNDGAAALAPRLGPALRHLNLSRCAFGADAFRHVIQSPGAVNLETLRLDGNHAADDGTLQLVELPCLTSLRTLGIGGTQPYHSATPLDPLGISPATLAALTQRGVFDHIERLYLSATPITSAHAAALAQLGTAQRLRMLDLVGCQLTAEGLRALLDGPLGDQLSELRLSANPLAIQGAQLLATRRAPRTSLDLSYLDLTDQGIDALLAAPWIASLRALNISQTGLSAQAARAMFDTPALALQILDMSYAPLGDDGAYWLSRAPGLSAMRTLQLSACQIGLRGLRAIITAPWSRTLESLDLAANPLDSDAVIALARAELPALRALNLEGVSIAPAAAAAIADASWLPALTTLKLDAHRLHDAARDALSLAQSLPKPLRASLIPLTPR